MYRYQIFITVAAVSTDDGNFVIHHIYCFGVINDDVLNDINDNFN